MTGRLTFEYDREGDILTLSKRPPYPEQASEELGDDVIARMNPATGEIESLEILFFSARLQASQPFDLPVDVDLRPAI